jgi:hypothetical protein
MRLVAERIAKKNWQQRPLIEMGGTVALMPHEHLSA